MKKSFGQTRSGEQLNTAGVHVTFRDNKRVLPFNQDDQVDVLRYQFLRSFSDVLDGQVAPANVTLQRYHSGFDEYVDISDEEKLEDGDKVKAIVGEYHKQQASGVKYPGPHDRFSNCAHMHIHSREYHTEEASGVKWPTFHGLSHNCVDMHICLAACQNKVLSGNHLYFCCISSSISHGLIRRDPDNNHVSCDGKLWDLNTVVEARRFVTRANGHQVYFIFTDADGDYYAIRATKAGVTTEKISDINNPPNDCIFEPTCNPKTMLTMIKKKVSKNSYLGCDGNGKVMLVDTDSPISEVLFFAHKVNPVVVW